MSTPHALDHCALEPIRIPGAIQPHGALLVLREPDLQVLQASANGEQILGAAIAHGHAITPLLGPRLAGELTAWTNGTDPIFRRVATVGDRRLQIVAHRSRQGMILELEPEDPADDQTLDDLYPAMQRFLEGIGEIAQPVAAAEAAARHVRRLTGFNRVLIYRFDQDWTGTVIAEDRDDALPSYLGLRFPAGDIPPQARELYLANRLRLIPDVNYVAVPVEPSISPLDGAALDLSPAGLRSVSPTHLGYMRNMGTAASMSVSLVIDGRLWGLISCHHAMPRRVGPAVRTVCASVGQFLAQHLGARERMEESAQRIALKRIATGLLARLARADTIQRGLAENAADWLSLAHATGAAMVTRNMVQTAGITPGEPWIRGLAAWLHAQNAPPVFAAERLAERYRPAAGFPETASGLLALSISRRHASCIMWFRPKLTRAVTWAGNPQAGNPQAGDAQAGDAQVGDAQVGNSKAGNPQAGAGNPQAGNPQAGDPQPGEPLHHAGPHPRRSFERWHELVRHQAEPWTRAEIDAAGDFRNAILELVLRRAEERAELTDELQRSNQELESFSYSVSHDLRAPFRHIMGYAELLAERASNLDDRSRHYLDSIVEAALSAGRLVDDLLDFSQLNRATLSSHRVDMDKLVGEARRSLIHETEGRTIEWRVGELPHAWGDPSLLRQAVLNLLSNAVKYTRGRDPAIIEVTGEQRGTETAYAIRDNGTGFDMAFVGKLFGVFQRLHRVEDFEGTGIGLALTKRVIDRHGGHIRAEGVVNEGASFMFSLPIRNMEPTLA